MIIPKIKKLDGTIKHVHCNDGVNHKLHWSGVRNEYGQIEVRTGCSEPECEVNKLGFLPFGRETLIPKEQFNELELYWWEFENLTKILETNI